MKIQRKKLRVPMARDLSDNGNLERLVRSMLRTDTGAGPRVAIRAEIEDVVGKMGGEWQEQDCLDRADVSVSKLSHPHVYSIVVAGGWNGTAPRDVVADSLSWSGTYRATFRARIEIGKPTLLFNIRVKVEVDLDDFAKAA